MREGEWGGKKAKSDKEEGRGEGRRADGKEENWWDRRRGWGEEEKDTVFMQYLLCQFLSHLGQDDG